MSIDAVGNFLTIIRNGLMVSKPFVAAPLSKLNVSIAQILKDEGFIKNFVIEKDENNSQALIKIFLKYVQGESVIHEITRMSTPSRRKYVGSKNIKPVIGGLGISILTTNKGILTNKKAQELKVGGEVLCTVW